MDGTALCGVRLDLGAAEGDSFTVRSMKAVKTGRNGVGYKPVSYTHLDALPDTEGRIRTLYDISCAMPFEKEAIICALYDDRDIEVEGAENML